jgi:hypothetical protein
MKEENNNPTSSSHFIFFFFLSFSSDPTPYYNARGVAINHMYRYPVTVSSKLQPGEVVFSKTGDGCYEGFQNVPTGGSMVIPWKVGPYSEEDWHKCMSTTNYEEK